MNKGNLKYFIGIIIMLVIDSLHSFFFENNDKYDVYFLYNHKRYLTNILYDISNLFKLSILTYWLKGLNHKVFTPLFITSLFVWISYFVFYNQKSSLLIMPIYLILLFIYNKNMFKK